MNLFELIYAFIKKNFKTVQETEDPNEKRKKLLQIFFGIALALGYAVLHVPPDVSIREIIYAFGVLFITLYFAFRTLKYFKLI